MENKLKLTWVLVCLGLVALYSCGSNRYAGESWEAEILSVRYEKQYSGGQQNYNGMVVDMKIRYIGEDAEVPAAAVYLLGDGDQRERALMVQTHHKDPASDKVIRSWLMDEGTRFKFKRGESLTKHYLTFLWKKPASGGRYSLVVGDIDPITIGF